VTTLALKVRWQRVAYGKNYPRKHRDALHGAPEMQIQARAQRHFMQRR
jgi:hypothetical protein